MKILITAATFAPSLEGPTFLDANTFADLEEDSARAIVAAGKGLHVDPKDDKTRVRALTAPAARVEVVVAAHKAAEKAAKAAQATGAPAA